MLWLRQTISQRLVADFPPRRPGFAYGQHVGFVVDKAALGQVFSETSVSLANHSTDFSIIIITRGWNNRPFSGRSVEWTLIPPPSMHINIKKGKPHNIWSEMKGISAEIRTMHFFSTTSGAFPLYLPCLHTAVIYNTAKWIFCSHVDSMLKRQGDPVCKYVCELTCF
jgi:hypothetical protein